MRILLDLWRLLDGAQRRKLFALQIVAIAMAFSTMVGIAAVIPFFAVLADPLSIHESPLLQALYERLQFSSERTFVVAAGFGFVAAVLLANSLNLLGSIAMNRYATGLGDRFHVALFEEYLHRDYRFHLDTERAALASNVLNEVSRLTNGVLHGALTLITSAVTTLCIVASMVVLSPVITVVAILGIGGSYAIIYALARLKIRHNGLIQTRFLRERGKLVDESLSAIKEILTSHRQDFFVAKFDHSCTATSAAGNATWAVAHSPRYVLDGLTVAGLVGVALFLSRGGKDLAPWLAQFTFVGFAAYRLLPALQQVFTAVVRLRADRPAFESISADLQGACHRARERTAAASTVGDSWRAPPQREIVLRDVSFRYATDSPLALSGVSLRIPAKTMIGIVGANGSGKTTLVDVILGLLRPQCGCVLVDGLTLNETNAIAWRQSIAYVPQHIALLDASIAENIAFGIPAAQVDMARVRHVVRLTWLDEMVASLPSALDTRIGEDGVRLSGGQRQRMGIARALYRNSSLLVLDEASSALDGQMEEELTAILETLRGHCTIVLIAHRLRAVRGCDLIFELDHGTISASGSYEQLLGESSWVRHVSDLSASL